MSDGGALPAGGRAADASARLVQLLILALAALAVAYGRSAIGPIQEGMRADQGFTDNQMALIVGPAVALPMALGSIPLGFVADRHARRLLVILSVALVAGAVATIGIADGIVALVAARALVGLALAAVIVAAYAMVGDLYAPAQRGRATMVMTVGETGGAPLAFALGGYLLSIDIEPAGWRGAALWMAAPLIPIALLTLALREPARAEQIASETGAVRAPLSAAWQALWRYRRLVVPLLLARIMVWLADGAVIAWGAPMLAREYGLSAGTIGAIMATALLVSCLAGPLIGGPLADLCQRRGGPRRTMLAMVVFALLSAAAGLFALLPEAGAAAITMTIFLALGFALGTMALTVALIVIPSDLRGIFLAITVVVGGLFSIGVAPPAVSALSVLMGGEAMIGEALAVICATTSLLGAAVFLLGARAMLERRPG